MLCWDLGRPPNLWQDIALFVPGCNNNQCKELSELLGKDRDKVGKGKTNMLDDLIGESDASGMEETITTKAAKKYTAKSRPRLAYKGKQKGQG